MKNLKDKLTTICGVIIAICGAISSLSAGGIVLPSWLITTCIILTAASGAVIGFFTGRRPNGGSMNNKQIEATNAG
jgi:membrane protein DedA with SNARE-associated domain